jgi:hypothetical protein
MDGKTLWVTVIVAAVVAIVVVLLFNSFAGVQQSPRTGVSESGLSVSAPPLPNLVVDLSSPSGGCGGGKGGNLSCSTVFSIVVYNSGNVTAGSSSTGIDVGRNGGGYSVSDSIPTPPIGAGQQVILNYTATNEPVGNYTAVARADVRRQVKETNENDNVDIYVYSVP